MKPKQQKIKTAEEAAAAGKCFSCYAFRTKGGLHCARKRCKYETTKTSRYWIGRE